VAYLTLFKRLFELLEAFLVIVEAGLLFEIDAE
jgi:hypothetical protein